MAGWSCLSMDSEGIREIVLRLADDLEDLGYPKPSSDVSGAGQVAAAVRDPRSKTDIDIIHDYMKELGRELVAEPVSWERDQAKQVLSEAWEAIKACVS